MSSLLTHIRAVHDDLGFTYQPSVAVAAGPDGLCDHIVGARIGRRAPSHGHMQCRVELLADGVDEGQSRRTQGLDRLLVQGWAIG